MKNFLILVLIIAIVLTPLVLRQNFIGTDSYYYENVVCQKQDWQSPNYLEYKIFSSFPCDVKFFKLAWIFIIALDLVAFWFLINSYGVKFKFRLLLIILFGLTFALTLFWQFEDDQLAFPLIIFGLGFVFKI